MNDEGVMVPYADQRPGLVLAILELALLVLGQRDLEMAADASGVGLRAAEGEEADVPISRHVLPLLPAGSGRPREAPAMTNCMMTKPGADIH